MPNRYWVGGTAAWDGTAGNKWAATSGGAGGASVPTTADDVFFNANSSGTCTIALGNAGAKSLTCTSFAGGIAGTAAITIAGSITLAAGQVYTHTGTVTITGSGTLTTSGKSFSAVTIDAPNTTVALGGALNVSSRIITVSQGAFDTANYSISAGQIISNQTAGIRTINAGSSTISLSVGSIQCISFSSSVNLTFNAGTSSIVLTNSFANINGGGKTFYNVSFTSTSSGEKILSNIPIVNNLSLAASALGVSGLALTNVVIQGTLTCRGSSAINRASIQSNILGTPRTLTANSIIADNCDFRDIIIAGNAAGSSPVNAGDCGGNSGIVFPTSKIVYRVGTSTVWSGFNSWALSSGGVGANANFPIPQDIAIIDNNTALIGTLSLDSTNTRYNYSTLDCSARTSPITLNHNVTVNRYGSYILGNGVTISGTSTQTFLGRSYYQFGSYGKTIPFAIEIQAINGGIQFIDSFTSLAALTVTRGELDANNYNVTCLGLSSTSTAYIRSIKMGSGLWSITGSGAVWSLNTANLTFDKGNANILLTNSSNSSRVFTGGGLAYNDLTIGGTTGVSTLSIVNANAFNKLASTKTVSQTITFANNQTIDTWSVKGTSGNTVTVNSSIAGTRRTFALTNATSGINFLNIRDIGIADPDKFYAGINSIDSGNNLNVIFNKAPSDPSASNIYYGAANITNLSFGGTTVTAVYYGSQKVF
jgi:hypothetical protein